jgi:hypothetical protein
MGGLAEGHLPFMRAQWNSIAPLCFAVGWFDRGAISDYTSVARL